MGEEHPGTPLTDQERAVLRGVVEGKTNQQIANDVHLSVATVKYYVSRLCRKLCQPNRVRLASYAVSEGLLRLSDPDRQE